MRISCLKLIFPLSVPALPAAESQTTSLPRRGLPVEIMGKVREWFNGEKDTKVTDCQKLAEMVPEFGKLWHSLVKGKGFNEKATQVIRSFLSGGDR